MKFPKTRTNIYVLVRHRRSTFQEPDAVLDSFRTYERAEEVAGVYQQQMVEAGLGYQYDFEIRTTTYYDE